MWKRIKALLVARRERGEDDVDSDPGVAGARETGGAPTQRHDSGATTGTGEAGGYVGRVAGQDVGYSGTTGAEARRDGEP